MGHEAYPNRFDRTHTISQIVERYQKFAGKKDDEAEAARVNEELKAAEGGRVRIAGCRFTFARMTSATRPGRYIKSWTMEIGSASKVFCSSRRPASFRST